MQLSYVHSLSSLPCDLLHQRLNLAGPLHTEDTGTSTETALVSRHAVRSILVLIGLVVLIKISPTSLIPDPRTNRIESFIEAGVAKYRKTTPRSCQEYWRFNALLQLMITLAQWHLTLYIYLS